MVSPNLQAIIVIGDIDVDYTEKKSKNFFTHLNPLMLPKSCILLAKTKVLI